MATLDAALALAARGFRVFPLRPYGKKPAVDNFPNVATTDPETIKAWWSGWNTGRPDEYNIGVSTNDFVVVDVDTKRGKPGLQSYHEIGGHYETFVVKTPTGGYHCYFTGPNSKLAQDILPGLDIRSHNGYVVGPGSVLFENGVTGQYECVVDKPLSVVPESIAARLEVPGRRARVDVGVELDTATAIENAAVWLQTTEPAVEGLGGDAHTYRTAVKLVRDFALSEETAHSLLAEHWNHRCSPPWDLDELWRKVQNASEYGQGDLGAARPEAFFHTVQVLPIPEPPPPEPPRARGVYMGNLPDAATITPRPWVVERLFMKGDVTVLAAAGAAGKSALQLTIACHFAVGKDFGPYKLKSTAPLRTLVYNAEDDCEEQTRRVLAICIQYGLEYNEVRKNIAVMGDENGELLLVSATHNVPVAYEPGIQFMIQAAKDEGAHIIMLDPLVNLHTCNENDNSHMRYVISQIRRIAKESGTAVMVAHHTSKGAGVAKDDPSSIRGAGAIVNSARIALKLSTIDEDDRRELGVAERDKLAYIRLDDAKSNMFQRSDTAIMWAKWHGVTLSTGDRVGVPVPQDMSDTKHAMRDFIATTLGFAMAMNGGGSMSMTAAVKALEDEDELYAKMGATKLKAVIERALRSPVTTVSGTVLCTRETKGGRDEVLITLT